MAKDNMLKFMKWDNTKY